MIYMNMNNIRVKIIKYENYFNCCFYMEPDLTVLFPFFKKNTIK